MVTAESFLIKMCSRLQFAVKKHTAIRPAVRIAAKSLLIQRLQYKARVVLIGAHTFSCGRIPYIVNVTELEC